MPKLSAIIACYRDALAIPIMHQRLTKVFALLKVEYEIIFVNDGSPDESEVVLKKLCQEDAHIIAIHHARNFGSQLAFTSGMNIASGDAVILMDGDLQDPPELIPLFYRKWVEGYEVVYGVRKDRKAPWFMKKMYKLFYRVFHALSYISVPLDAGDFSLLDRKVVNALKQVPERDRFLRGLRAWVGFKQTGVVYTRPDRVFGNSTNSLVKNFLWATKGIFSFSFVPLQLITFVSLITFFCSVIGIFIQIVLKILIPSTPPGLSTIIVLVLFLGSVQLLCLSILGEYIAKIFEESKKRPLYIVKEITSASHVTQAQPE